MKSPERVIPLFERHEKIDAAVQQNRSIMEPARPSTNFWRSLVTVWNALAAPASPSELARSSGEPDQPSVAPPSAVDEQAGDSFLGYVD